MHEQDTALAATLIALASESRRIGKMILIVAMLEALVIISMVCCFFYWFSGFEFTETTAVTESTTVTQDSEGEGTNVYQAGESAVYNDGR